MPDSVLMHVSEDWLPRHRLTVHEYYRMAEVGLLAPDARVELIDGEIIDMAPTGSPHSGTVDHLARLLMRAAGDLAILGVQRPIRLSERDEPRPDLVLLRARSDFYRGSHPCAADVLLVVEVSDTTLRYDRGVKVPLYARHGIAEVWIVDLEKRRVHFHRSPAGATFADVSATDRPGRTPVATLPGVVVDLTEIL